MHGEMTITGRIIAVFVGVFLVELALQLASIFFVDVDLITRPPWWRANTSVPVLARIIHETA